MYRTNELRLLLDSKAEIVLKYVEEAELVSVNASDAFSELEMAESVIFALQVHVTKLLALINYYAVYFLKYYFIVSGTQMYHIV